MLLARLGYQVGPLDAVLDEQTKAAIKAYEKKRGLKVTGDPLSFDTMKQVNIDRSALDYEPVSLPLLYVYTEFWDEGYFAANGTWRLAGEAMGAPEQATTIECRRSEGVCLEATAVVTRWSGAALGVDLETYKIERWDKHEIVTEPEDRQCTRYVRRINRLTKSVSGIRTTISRSGACAGVDAGEESMTLSDGMEVSNELHRKRRKDFDELMLLTPAARKALEP
jgi:peptidoglycan hydrolase-like protein with peptidoglycan-binding domain